MYVFKENVIETYNTNYQVAYVFVFVFVFRVSLKDVIDQNKINVWHNIYILGYATSYNHI